MQIYDTFNAPNVGVKLIVYGKSGIGKTVLCSTAPAPIILSAEKGLLSLRTMHIPYIPINSLLDLIGAYQFLQSPQGAQFQTICLDSITEIAEVVLTNELKTSGKNDPRKAYGELAVQVLGIFRQFRDAPRHVVFTAQMGNYKDGLTGALMWGPAFPGQQLDQKVPYMFDELFQLLTAKDPTTGKDFRVLRTQPDNQNEAKDRSGRLDPWEYPDLTHIFNKIMGV